MKPTLGLPSGSAIASPHPPPTPERVPRSARRAWREAWRTAWHRAPRGVRILWGEKAAAAHTVFYLVSAAIFLPLIGGLFLYMKDSAGGAPDNSAGLQSRADAALLQITSNSGKVANQASSYWEHWGLTVAVDEIGLKDENTSLLSYGKIDNLQRGGLQDSAGDPFINYPEFERALGIGADDFDFHMRLTPIIANPANDPYGTRPLDAMKVALVTDVTSCWVDDSDASFRDTTPAADKEIAALERLGLVFDATFYQPVKTNTLDCQEGAPIPDDDGFVNPLNPIRGDLIADSARLYSDATLPTPVTKPYHQWFWEDHFMDGSNYRYDAIIFGGGVDQALMAQHGRGVVTDFVKQGGVVIFMGSSAWAPDFVNQCSDTDCLFWSTGTQQAPTTPDVTNQMLFVPNRIDLADYPDGSADWDICDYTGSGGKDEKLGFIPIERAEQTVGPPACVHTNFGATSADRFGQLGGTVIVNRWIFDASTSTDKAAKILANMLSYGLLRPVYMDYGPEIPVDAPVASAERLMVVQFPNGDFMDVKMVLYLWRAG